MTSFLKLCNLALVLGRILFRTFYVCFVVFTRHLFVYVCFESTYVVILLRVLCRFYVCFVIMLKFLDLFLFDVDTLPKI